MLDSNASVGVLDTIVFNIPGSGVQTIGPTSALPAITDAAIIDGTTQPGYSGTPLIELHGVNAGSSTDGLDIDAGNTTLQIDADMVVHGAGRVPEIDDLDLDEAGVRWDQHGVTVNEYLQSVSNPAARQS